MTVIATIITHNRLALLKESVQGIREQHVPVQKIIVVNNGSTDGTKEWLDAQQDLISIHRENLGGSDGFAEGIKQSYESGADWIWVMDDDSIPGKDALKELVSLTSHPGIDENIGFLCSRVEWTDGSPHLMNIPHISIFNKRGQPFNRYDNIGGLYVQACSFVSILVSAKAVKACGLPYRSFFIWGDDMEYTQRIIRAGFEGLYVPSSIVLHKTATNYSANIFTDDDKSLWKYRYGIRNSLFIIKKQKGALSFSGKFLKHIFVIPFKILKKRKSHRWAFIRVVWKAAWSSVFFNPKPDQIHG